MNAYTNNLDSRIHLGILNRHQAACTINSTGINNPSNIKISGYTRTRFDSFESAFADLLIFYGNNEVAAMKRKEKQKKAGKIVTNITQEERKEQCGCVSSETAKSGLSEKAEVKLLKIKWQRLISERETCPRCSSTEKEIDKAVSALSKSLAPLGIKVRLEKEELSVSEFKKDPLQSNRILINDRLLEDWIGGEVGHSSCCDVCGPSECRTLAIKGKIYEVIPAELIIKAGLIAASALYSED